MGGDAVTALARARDVGLQVWVEPDRLVVRGPRSLEPVARSVLAQSREVSALLEAEEGEFAWRVSAMRPRVPAKGPILLLVARDLAPAPGSCLSCGDPLPGGRAVRCALCIRAARRVLVEIREGCIDG